MLFLSAKSGEAAGRTAEAWEEGVVSVHKEQ
jgi:hypothetical protein